MGYWSTIPMGGDYPLDIQDNMRKELIFSFSPNKVVEKYLDLSEDICDPIKYEIMINEFTKWIRLCAIYEEDELIDFVKDFHNNQEEEIRFSVPLSLLEWGVTVNKDSKLSKLLLEMIKNTDGGSDYRGYTDKENLYPNKLYTPNDFIKYYIDNWDDIITGKINFNDIKSDVDIIPKLGFSMLNIK